MCGTIPTGEIFYEREGVKFSVNAEVSIHVRNSTGQMHPGVVVKIDHDADLCALSVPTFKAAPVKFSRNSPDIGDEVIALSAPFGINSPTMTLTFTGKYSGKSGKWHFYTIPTRPGSSGSVVLNKKYRGVGMLNAAFQDIETVGMGAGHEETQQFLRSIE